MMKGLTVMNQSKIRINKFLIHSIVYRLKKELNFQVDFLQINFVISGYILRLNNEYLSHNFTTDIITFNYSEESYKFDGEIFISINDALKNAKRYKVSLDVELLRLIIHGLLHLRGYDDINEADRKIMKKKEDFLVNKNLDLLKGKNLTYDY
ncbi:endoribonuclease YbeY [bacterium BMS3Abin04]|nr:endoribonuclease YbeY [bacterium BMS3Abin04]